jgi:hypothetical protein
MFGALQDRKCKAGRDLRHRRGQRFVRTGLPAVDPPACQETGRQLARGCRSSTGARQAFQQMLFPGPIDMFTQTVNQADDRNGGIALAEAPVIDG